MDYIPLEKPIAELEAKITDLRKIAASSEDNLESQIKELENKANKLRLKMFSKLTPYETVQISRHPRRPNTLDYINFMCSSFIELHGDRNYFDDPAIVGGLGIMDGNPMVIIGHQKGRGTKGNIERNFGMPKPEGYRKALRLMSLAERFNLPLVTLIDTPGAYPGIGAEERGQSEAIGKNIMVMSKLKIPIICVVIGEGGSGGALALAVGNRVHMLQYSIYSVISPEGCASILMKDASLASRAADALQLTAQSSLKLGIIDGIIEEPLGGAHRGMEVTGTHVKAQILADLAELQALAPEKLRDQRMEKFLEMNFTKE